jgi:hypothetical protein
MGYREINGIWLYIGFLFASKAFARLETKTSFIVRSIEMHRYAQKKEIYLEMHNYAVMRGEQLLEPRIIVPKFQITY